MWSEEHKSFSKIYPAIFQEQAALLAPALKWLPNTGITTLHKQSHEFKRAREHGD